MAFGDGPGVLERVHSRRSRSGGGWLRGAGYRSGGYRWSRTSAGFGWLPKRRLRLYSSREWGELALGVQPSASAVGYYESFCFPGRGTPCSIGENLRSALDCQEVGRRLASCGGDFVGPVASLRLVGRALWVRQPATNFHGAMRTLAIGLWASVTPSCRRAASSGAMGRLYGEVRS